MKQASANIGWGWGKLYKCKLEAGGGGGGAVTPVHFPGIWSATPDAHPRARKSAHVFPTTWRMTRSRGAWWAWPCARVLRPRRLRHRPLHNCSRHLGHVPHSLPLRSRRRHQKQSSQAQDGYHCAARQRVELYRLLRHVPCFVRKPRPPFPPSTRTPHVSPSLPLFVSTSLTAFVRCFEAAEAAKDRCSPELPSFSVFLFHLTLAAAWK